ncbi:magnesium transporter [Treponema phagedenis]|uniref:Magnesium transporter MgtE n=1 Tax=Treponema phagedenis TaxID=162 RepID=A0A0B7GZS2_TREPH|nr:magnesium transporter [Treponema phagedenis]EFW37205.1 magnesium transporter [Treponema phagedenis F0421]CEM63142.1 Magnesium transporter [Treponema phagedenis]
MNTEKLEKIQEFIENKHYVALMSLLSQSNEVDIAEILDEETPANALLLFRMLPKDLAADVFAQLSSEQQSAFLNLITDKELVPILDDLAIDDIVDLVEEMPANAVKRILAHASETDRTIINQFLRYPQDSAGSLMTIEYVNLKKTMTVAQALQQIKATGLKKETIYTCYVIDENRFLQGIVSLRSLVLNESDTLIQDIYEEDCIYVHTNDDQETVASVFKKYGFLALPVVDTETRLIGIITVDDIMDVMQQEATEDFQIMAAMQPSEEAYLDTGVFALAKHRIGWLLLLMVSETFTGNIIDRYTDLLATMTVLTTFIPMLMDTGGNSGSQSSTLIIRGLATGEIQQKDWLKILWKELRIAMMVGIILGAIIFAKSYYISRKPLAVSASVGLTLIITVTISKLTGGILPIIAKRLKMDPAIMAGPLITTIVDALSLVVFFNISQWMLF